MAKSLAAYKAVEDFHGSAVQMVVMSDGVTRIRTFPADGHVDIWTVNLEGETERCAAVLSTAERDRLSRRCGDERRRFVRSHAALREIVAEYLGGTAIDVELSAPYGSAPAVPGDLRLSLTHCEDVALIAVATAPVGIDVETLLAADDEDLEDLAEFALTDRELRDFRGLEAAGRPRSFVQLWARKEALLKARGQGLGDRLLRDVEAQGRATEGLTLTDLELDPTHLGAVALEHPAPEITWREWRG